MSAYLTRIRNRRDTNRPTNLSNIAESPRRPKLMDTLRQILRARHYSRGTEQTYCLWVKRYIFYHNIKHPVDMAEPEINAFLTRVEP